MPSITLILRQQNIEFLRRPNAEITLTCPLCSYGSPNVDRAGALTYNTLRHVGRCYRCGWTCHKEKELLKLLNISGPSNISWKDIAIPSKKSIINPIPENCVPAWRDKSAKDYLRGRGLTVQQMEKFTLLYCKEGYYAERIIAPVFSHRGEYRTFVSRAIGGSAQKYLYPKGTSISKLLYNMHLLRGKKYSLLLVEGMFDAVHVYPEGVCTFGKNISDAQIQVLKSCGIQRVYLVWDAEAWQKTPQIWEKSVHKLSKHFFTYPIKLPYDTPTEYPKDTLLAMCKEQERRLI